MVQEVGINLTKCKFLQGTVVCLRKHKPDKRPFEGQKANIDKKVLPLDVIQADGVDESAEKSGGTAEQLEPGHSFGADVKGEKLNQKGICKGVVSNCVRRAVQVDEDDDDDARRNVSCNHLSGLGDCPSGVDAEKTSCAEEIHPSPWESWDSHGESHTHYQIPSGISQVNFVLHKGIGVTDCFENNDQVVAD